MIKATLVVIALLSLTAIVQAAGAQAASDLGQSNSITNAGGTAGAAASATPGAAPGTRRGRGGGRGFGGRGVRVLAATAAGSPAAVLRSQAAAGETG